MELKEFYINNYEVIKWIIGALTLGFGIFFKSYLNEKGKLKAVKSENAKLINQTEEIKAKYSRELEELKKEHQLDITKRKYQYETKKEAYTKFFSILDEFSYENNIKGQENMQPILEEFNRNYINAKTESQQNKAVVVMSKKIQSLTFESLKEVTRVKNENKLIKLIASDEIIHKLNSLDRALDNSSDVANSAIKNLPTLMVTNNQAQIEKDKNDIETWGGIVKDINDEIMQLMRKELNEI
ncbi:MAG: hypothetical protein RSE41_03175 [Clostridia bacterium]